jgi:hypothetical protein
VSLGVGLALILTTAGVAPAGAATVTNIWWAPIGSAGANGTATVQAYTSGTGSIALKLAKVKASTVMAVKVHKGTCSTVGAVLLTLPTIRTSSAGAASRTSTLTTTQVKAVKAATTGSGRIAIRVGSGSTLRCGALRSRAIITVSGPSGTLATGGQQMFAASVNGSPSTAVTWSVVERGGGSITQDGVYTAPATPGTYTVKATSRADTTASGTASVPVVIPVGHIPSYDVGVDYHAFGADFLKTAFITQYQKPDVRRVVRAQLQGMADRGATVISTRIWLVTEPGTANFDEAWRATFPLSDQEKSNLRLYAQDVAAVRGAGGNRLRLDLCLLWLGAADYMRGTLASGLGWTPLMPAEFTRRVEVTTDRVLAAVAGVKRSDGVPVVDMIYLDGEVMIGAKANQEWFLRTHYRRFVERVSAAGFRPSLYFGASDTVYAYLTPGYTDVDYPILNGHRSMFWMYRSLRFMADEGLPLPERVDFSWYVPATADASSATLLARALDDADATLPSLGLQPSYGIAETYYLLDPVARRELGQAIAGEAAANSRLKRVTFWTTPDGGGPGVNVGYPFAIEDYFPPEGADEITGSGQRDGVAFEFHVVLNPSGTAIGRFDSSLMSNIGVLFQGDVDCGWVSGNIGVLGGLMDGADPASPDSYFTVMVSDGPDGIIIGNGRPQWGIDGFGDPRGLPISSGEIVVVDR